MAAEQALKQKLLASGLEPEGFAIPLRNMRAEADLFREENLPLLAEENKLRTEYDKIIGAQTVTWEGQERTVDQMKPVYQDADRARREQAWRLVAERQLADREAINQVWGKLFALRRKMAENAGRPDYRAYRWQEMLRFDYTPAGRAPFPRGDRGSGGAGRAADLRAPPQAPGPGYAAPLGPGCRSLWPAAAAPVPAALRS